MKEIAPGYLEQRRSISLNRADLLLLGSNVDSIADRLLDESDENRALVQALWNLSGAIEKVDDDAFRSDYGDLLAQAGAYYRGFFDDN